MTDSPAIRAFYFDGATAFRHEVTLIDAGHGLRIMAEDGTEIGGVLYADMVWREAQNGLPIFGLKDSEGWRLGFLDSPPTAMVAKLPRAVKYGGVIDRIGLGGAMVGFAVVSVGALALFAAMPQWLAPLVPYSWEQKMGDAMVGDFGGRLCQTPEGTAALNRLATKLDDQHQELDIQVANIEMINAVALPGGKIIIFQGLLDDAKSSDEIAGVLAHEIGHVRRRHVMQSLLRQMGLSFLLGGIDGQAGGALNSLLSMAYGRDAERDADNWSIARMAGAKIDPTDTAGFFTRMSVGGADDDVAAGKAKAGDKANKKIAKTDEAESAKVERALSYVATHPANADRTKAFLGSKKANVAYAPALNAAEWKAVLTMCENDPDVKEGDSVIFN
jgi:beta-barrel assembly-enhancing protease